jgi:hypothetical protein
VNEAIQGLPDDLRGPVQLRYVAGLPNREIAAALGIAERTVEDRLRRGREALRAKLSRSSLGLGAILAALEVEAAPPPAGLLPGLLRISSMGSALSGAAVPLQAAGTGLAKKLVLSSAAALLLIATPVSVGIWSGTRRAEAPPAGRGEAPLAVRGPPSAAQPEAPPPGATAEKRPGAASAPVTVVRGFVRDEEENRIAGAVIRIRLGEEAEGARTFEAVSDEVGEFVFPDVPAPRGYLTAEKEGYLLSRRDWPMTIEDEKDREINVLLCRPRRLAGRILDASGRPIEGAEAWIDGNVATHVPGAPEEARPSIRGYEHWRRFPAGAGGSYDTGRRLIVNDGVPSNLNVRAVAPGFATLERKAAREDFEDGDARLDFTLEPEMPIAILAVDPAGGPIEGAEVGLGSEESWDGRRDVHGVATTDAAGRAVLPHHPPARLRLRVEAEGYRTAATFVEPGTSTDVRVTLSPLGPGVRARVTFADDFPAEERKVTDVYFECRDEAGRVSRLHRPREERNPETGELTFWPDAGRYVLRVELGLLSRASEPFVYTGMEPLKVDMHFAIEAPYLAGTAVRAGTEEPVAGVDVVARFVERGEEFRSSWGRFSTVNGFAFPGRPGNARGTRTDAAGKFLLLLPRAGGGRGFSIPESSVAALAAGSDEHGWAEDLAIEFDDRTKIEDLRLEIIPGGSIEGSVTGGAGEPSVGEIVVASDLQGWTRWARTDRDGRYRIDRLRAGSYLLLPIGQVGEPSIGGGMGGGESRDGVPPPHELFDRPVRVESGQSARRDLDIRKDRPGRVEGTVGAEIAQGRIARHALIVRGVPQEHAATLGGEEEIREGRFAFEALHEGAYRLSVMAEHFEHLAEADVEVRRGGLARVHLERPRAALSVPISSRDGQRTSDVRIVRVERLAGGRESERWAHGALVEEAGALRIESLPAGRVRVLLASSAHVPAWSEPILLVEGAEAVAPAVHLERGQEIHVRIEPPPGTEPPEDVRFRVAPSPDGPPVEHMARRLAADPVWVLSAFAPGRYVLSAEAGGHFRAERAAVDVAPGRPVEVVLPLDVQR